MTNNLLLCMKQDIIYFIGFGFFNYHYPEEPKGFLPGLKIGYTSNWKKLEK